MRAPHVLRISLLCSLALGVFSTQGCGDDGGGKKLPGFDAGTDAGNGDQDFDGSIGVPTKHDSGMVAPGEPDDDLVGRCAVDTNKIFTAVETDTLLYGTPLAVDPIDSQFAIPYVSPSASCLDAVYLTTLAGSNTAPAPTTVVGADNCTLVSSPATTFAGDSWLLAFVDNRSGTNSIWVQPFNPKTEKMGKGQLLSATNGVSIAINTLRDGSVLAAWSDEGPDGAGVLRVRKVSATGKALGEEQVIENGKPGDDPVMNPLLHYKGLVLTTLGPDGAGLGYWRYDDKLARSELVFQPLDNSGKPTLPALILTENAGPNAGIDVDVNEFGGAIVYTQTEGTGRQLWFQAIDDTGALEALTSSSGTAPPIRLVNSPFLGIDVSIAKLRMSHVIAYRALPAVNEERAQIRVIFLNKGGNKLGDSDVSFTSSTGGRTAIKAAYDGRVVLAWTEIGDMGQSLIKVVRLPCTG